MVRDEEFELIPVSPIRRLEKRLERLESVSTEGTSSVYKDMVDIIRMNQEIVDELAKSNDTLRIELSKLPGKLDELIMNMKELISFIKSSGEQDAVGVTQEAMKPVVDKLDEIVKTNKAATEKNDAMLDLLDTISKRVKRPVGHAPMRSVLMRPLPSLRPQTFKKSEPEKL